MLNEFMSTDHDALNEFMSTDEVLLFYLMIMCGWLPPCHEGVADCRPDRFLLSVKFVHKCVVTSARI